MPLAAEALNAAAEGSAGIHELREHPTPGSKPSCEAPAGAKDGNNAKAGLGDAAMKPAEEPSLPDATSHRLMPSDSGSDSGNDLVLHGSGRSKPDPSLASAGTMAHDRLLYLLQQACSYEEEASMVQECLRTLHQRNQHRASLSAAEAHRWAEQGLVEALASFLEYVIRDIAQVGTGRLHPALSGGLPAGAERTSLSLPAATSTLAHMAAALPGGIASRLLPVQAPARWFSAAGTSAAAGAQAVTAVAAAAGCYPPSHQGLNLLHNVSGPLWEAAAEALTEGSFGAVLRGLLGPEDSTDDVPDVPSGQAVEQPPADSPHGPHSGRILTSADLHKLLQADMVPAAADNSPQRPANGHSGELPAASEARRRRLSELLSANGKLPAAVGTSTQRLPRSRSGTPTKRIMAAFSLTADTHTDARPAAPASCASEDSELVAGRCEEGLALAHLLLHSLACKEVDESSPEAVLEAEELQFLGCCSALLASHHVHTALVQLLQTRGLGCHLSSAMLQTVQTAASSCGPAAPAMAALCSGPLPQVLLEAFAMRGTRPYQLDGAAKQATTMSLNTLLVIFNELSEVEVVVVQEQGSPAGSSTAATPGPGISPSSSAPGTPQLVAGEVRPAASAVSESGSTSGTNLPQVAGHQPIQQLLASGGHIAAMLEVVSTGVCGVFSEDMLPLINKLACGVTGGLERDVKRLARVPKVRAMLLELVLQMAQAQGLYDSNSSTVSPAEAALQLLCHLYGGSMSLSDLCQARLHELARLPLLAPSGAAAKKVSLVHCSIMRLLAARVAVWSQRGPPPTLAVLKSFGQALALQLEALMQLLVQPELCTPEVCELAGSVVAVATALVSERDGEAMEALARAGLLTAIVEVFAAAGSVPGMQPATTWAFSALGAISCWAADNMPRRKSASRHRHTEDHHSSHHSSHHHHHNRTSAVRIGRPPAGRSTSSGSSIASASRPRTPHQLATVLEGETGSGRRVAIEEHADCSTQRVALHTDTADVAAAADLPGTSRLSCASLARVATDVPSVALGLSRTHSEIEEVSEQGGGPLGAALAGAAAARTRLWLPGDSRRSSLDEQSHPSSSPAPASVLTSAAALSGPASASGASGSPPTRAATFAQRNLLELASAAVQEEPPGTTSQPPVHAPKVQLPQGSGQMLLTRPPSRAMSRSSSTTSLSTVDMPPTPSASGPLARAPSWTAGQRAVPSTSTTSRSGRMVPLPLMSGAVNARNAAVALACVAFEILDRLAQPQVVAMMLARLPGPGGSERALLLALSPLVMALEYGSLGSPLLEEARLWDAISSVLSSSSRHAAWRTAVYSVRVLRHFHCRDPCKYPTGEAGLQRVHVLLRRFTAVAEAIKAGGCQSLFAHDHPGFNLPKVATGTTRKAAHSASAALGSPLQPLSADASPHRRSAPVPAALTHSPAGTSTAARPVQTSRSSRSIRAAADHTSPASQRQAPYSSPSPASTPASTPARPPVSPGLCPSPGRAMQCPSPRRTSFSSNSSLQGLMVLRRTSTSSIGSAAEASNMGEPHHALPDSPQAPWLGQPSPGQVHILQRQAAHDGLRAHLQQLEAQQQVEAFLAEANVVPSTLAAAVAEEKAAAGCGRSSSGLLPRTSQLKGGSGKQGKALRCLCFGP